MNRRRLLSVTGALPITALLAGGSRAEVAWKATQSVRITQNGRASYSSSSTGQSPHLSAAWFIQFTGAKAEHLPYRGAAPALQDLAAGMTQFLFDNLTTGIEFVRAGKLRALGITSAERNSLTPELVPICETMTELRPFDVSTWFGIVVPTGTPRSIVGAISAQTKAWLGDPQTKGRFRAMAGFPVYGTPEQLAHLVASQIALWKGVIGEEGLKLDVN
jgi:tripartite-type tricarboxylate transporter receptor subunit TctC